MFPQSELDNYKLQVELLQQKLQRSEISRQQLEHKLDKILQKRDEHDKMVRTKARQKHQQFLEEQQRRNERNKQLVQMLERIEQQTEALNAKSERLKMMKLQYEMYFAKLVHSQTRRCIQNSIIPVTHMMTPPGTQHIQTATVLQPTLEGHNYDVNYETSTPRMNYPYQTHIPHSNYFENEPTLRSQSENIPTKATEMPTLANLVTTSRNDCDNFRNLNVDCALQLQQTQQHQPKYETRDNNTTVPTNITFHKQEMPHNIFDSKNSANISFSSVSDLLTNDKQISEFNENSNLPSTSSTFEEVPNLAMMPQKGHNLKTLYQKASINIYNDAANNKDNLNSTANVQQLSNNQDINKVPLKYTNKTDINATNTPPNIDNANLATQNLRNEIKSPLDNTGYAPKTNDITMPKLNKKPMTSLELETSATKEIETSPNSAKNTNYINRQTEHTTDPLKSESTAKYNESNSYATPVSIENIENKIYGELLSPIEIEEVQKADGTKVVPKLLENLVTQQQHENVEIENNTTEELLPENNEASTTNSVNDAAVIDNKNEQNSVEQNYEQAYNEYNNTQQQPGDLSNNFADYTNYENVDSNAINNEGQQQQQQQQQYDYSNYDPTQYSYPGYIYDEATGEYKPDPNAPAEQYATDQQYAAEAYDQQYQQQNYDYNQTYLEDPTQSTAYNNYDTQQQDISPNLIQQSDINAEEQQAITNPEPITTTVQPDLTPEEVPITSTKVAKPTSILSTADNKNESHKKKKRVNFIDSSETDNSASAEKVAPSTAKPTAGSLTGSSESDFDFPSSTEAGLKAT